MLLRRELMSNPREAMELIRQERDRSIRNGSSTIIECKQNGDLFITNYRPASGYHSEGHFIGTIPRHPRSESRFSETRHDSGDYRRGNPRQNFRPEIDYPGDFRRDCPRQNSGYESGYPSDFRRDYPRHNFGYESAHPGDFRRGYPRRDFGSEFGYPFERPERSMFQRPMGSLRFDFSQQPYNNGMRNNLGYQGYQPSFRSMPNMYQPRLSLGIGLSFALRF